MKGKRSLATFTRRRKGEKRYCERTVRMPDRRRELDLVGPVDLEHRLQDHVSIKIRMRGLEA